ncbi:hypothetical protein LZZ85_03860 [Terrimonas sp. NA20]|uniref:Copper-binding protein MbnP-like domain-containing protein n=1 Tax=Terrimonas ginsenosidimutans TaxID=2908004 RepID=A0ABS9KM49_9BACT|nr:MbnP family protein [Terrimonas ginsenosidimutans]MCG2613397.1 hypothetical protein [Terrimonas ginsenosidimutans]
MVTVNLMVLKSRYYSYFLSVTFISALISLIPQPGLAQKNNRPVATATVSLEFVHTVGTREFSPDSIYKNDFGESFTVSRFRYYISNIQWHNRKTGKLYKTPASYFLIDEAEPLSKQIDLKVPAGQYTSLSFLIGVDSLKNISGAQDGALDPINGMFWTWQTGYIMAKLEGSSPVSKLPRNMFEFHIGGFKGPYNVLQRVEIPVTERMPIITGSKQSTIRISVDINKWFNGKHPLPLSKHTACMTPGELSLQYAENYITMFNAAEAQ